MSPSVRAHKQSYSFLSFFCFLPSWSTDLLQILAKNNHCRAGNVWCFWSERMCMCVCGAEKVLHLESIVMASKWWMISSSACTVMKTHYWSDLPIECENAPMLLSRCSNVRPEVQVIEEKFLMSRTHSRVRHNRRESALVPVSRDLGLWGKAM